MRKPFTRRPLRHEYWAMRDDARLQQLLAEGLPYDTALRRLAEERQQRFVRAAIRRFWRTLGQPQSD
jgi:hypothetical protein